MDPAGGVRDVTELTKGLFGRGLRRKLAEKRIASILRSYVVASARTLEQKISDAGPTNQRVDPHVITTALKTLTQKGLVVKLKRIIPWYHLSETDKSLVEGRLNKLLRLHQKINHGQSPHLLGQALEVAVFRALDLQRNLSFFGNFPDLISHDDSSLYSKTEPPSDLNGRFLPKRKLDFLVNSQPGGYAGIEIKNIREWIYPAREEVLELLSKCCALDVVPVLIARRIHYSYVQRPQPVRRHLASNLQPVLSKHVFAISGRSQRQKLPRLPRRQGWQPTRRQTHGISSTSISPTSSVKLAKNSTNSKTY